ncbi:MAG TPA: hypothetical protein VFB43_13820 [Terracidiphilus sp.]|nr:hypothetical protein [Terracidiphilus sp.]
MRSTHLSIASGIAPAIVFGLALSAGFAIAQTPAPNPNQDANQSQQPAASASPLATESAPTTQPQHASDPDRAAQHLGKQLGLSQDQVDQLKPILADRQQQVASIRSDSTLTPRDRRAKLRSIQQDSKTKIEALLTDSQKQQFEQILADRRAHHKQQPQAQ